MLNGTDLASNRSGSVSEGVQNNDKYLWYETACILKFGNSDAELRKQLCDFVADNFRTSGECAIERASTLGSMFSTNHTAHEYDVMCSLANEARFLLYIENQYFISDDTTRNKFASHLLNCMERHLTLQLVIVSNLYFEDTDSSFIVTILQTETYKTYQFLSSEMEKRGMDPLRLAFGFFIWKTEGDRPIQKSLPIFNHSKVMVVDDHAIHITTSNIADRSLLDNRDVEMGILLRGKKHVDNWKQSRASMSFGKCVSFVPINDCLPMTRRLQLDSFDKFHHCLIATLFENDRIV
jgi:phosphatidylserine/phosphatidylglycerophosphate/cardiolipin synthase-like enzyme